MSSKCERVRLSFEINYEEGKMFREVGSSRQKIEIFSYGRRHVESSENEHNGRLLGLLSECWDVLVQFESIIEMMILTIHYMYR